MESGSLRMNKQSLSGIAGVFHAEQSERILYYMMHSLQHLGQDGCGMAIADGSHVMVEKNHGLLAEVFKEDVLSKNTGISAVGHVRMSMYLDEALENLQPIMVRAHQGHFAIVVSGSILNARELQEEMEADGLIFRGNSDAELIAHLIQFNHGHLFEKILSATKRLVGSYTFLLMTKNTMYAYRSSDGIHPLFLASYKGGYLLASETSAFSMFDVEEFRSLEAGELIRFGKEDVRSFFLNDRAQERLCAMEFVYYARMDSLFENVSVHTVRKKTGAMLARQERVDADLVVAAPDTATSAAMAFASVLKKPYEIGLVKNRYIGSTYIYPSSVQRMQGIKTRFNAVSSIVKGKRVYLVDDSLIKGFTAKRLCQLLKEAGAKEVHLRIASPRIVSECWYGFEEADHDELAANVYSDDELAKWLNVDSVRFLELEEFDACLPMDCCQACMRKEREHCGRKI